VLTLINANRMSPPIAPIGLDYVATAARRAGIETRVIDLGLADDADAELARGLEGPRPALVGISFRNIDDCFWPSATSFVPDLVALVARVRTLCDAPVVLGGVGLSLFPERILERTGAQFAIRGDGEASTAALHRALVGRSDLSRVPGLIRREGDGFVRNPPSWPDPPLVPTTRDAIDNGEYFRRGGQGGVETARGCPRACIYCADSVAKGKRLRLRPADDVAEEFESLARQGVYVVHLCDAEVNLDAAHARNVCDALVRRRVHERTTFYAYAAVTPFDHDLARALCRAGCVGVNFGADSASDAVLARYGQAHRQQDLERTVRLCKEHGIRCMIDLLIGGPGETPLTVRHTIDVLKRIGPDCVGASVGMRLYPGTAAEALARAGEGLRRRYTGDVDLLEPTYYIAPELGPDPQGLVRDLIGGDPRFFPPATESGSPAWDHNYNDNRLLSDAIANGARGAYWDILRKLRH
jgi:radical SAM superfamily enzyme YgiQ (UPF0313 family)